ncbi:universal stress protein [Natronobacterium gregoryi]|uniref:Universal stress protein n=2 Tax=Natronobacterium gregoryi TaxID=44930 RepID=L0ADL6_NATGS|nr:universal stress protein [Natronobacterium gregoryi]AFZ71946.1 universal stress protein UspA-like protein [Natronobacterium gregoryi SP2]ELY62559.1 UspA domain-containing protein [Natronobacterium gregoryi SP2]PLK20723.1 universal stress protein [Natronobacterium gregoryi SP2]SFJ13142.1 Nucleotide-binding universal stress protein, UspA family [Natronobacterium gregoryi]
MYDTILVPTDGSDPANQATEHALTLADRYDADVYVMYCVETHRYGEHALSSADIVLNRLEEQGQAMLEEVTDRANSAGIDCEYTICHGRPWEEVQNKADEFDADLVVIGFQGQSHTRSGKIGSVAERVVRTADRPVLTA